jgi:uncharacterized protein (TIGR00369 family)
MTDSFRNRELWFERIAEFKPRTIMGALNIDLVDIDDDHIELRMPITDAVRQPMGMLHGGASMVLAETAASIHAAWGRDLSQVVPVGIEISGSHVRSARAGQVRAVGRIIAGGGGDLVVHQVEIVAEDSGELLCSARVTNLYLKTNATLKLP